MIESFVDLTYRGLQLGRRIKLAQVRPTSGYLEMPAPMPVGTTIGITTDEGLVFEAMVRVIHEQVGGSDRIPGMIVAPALAKEDVAAWWTARVGLPEAAPEAPRVIIARPEPTPVVEAATVIGPPPVLAPEPVPAVSAPVHRDEDIMAAANAMAAIPERGATVWPRSQTAVNPVIVEEPTEMTPPTRVSEEHAAQELVDDGKKTVVMDSIDPALIEQLMKGAGSSGELPVVDDGKRTMIMDSAVPQETTDPEPSQEMVIEYGTDDDAKDEKDDAKDDRTSKPLVPGGTVRRRRAQKKR